MKMKSFINNVILRKKNNSIEQNVENIDLKIPVDFNQAFFLYNVYQWMLEKPQAANDKMEINSLIAINYYRLKKKFHFPDSSFDNFENRNELPISDYVDDLYRVKVKEFLISELNLSFILTEYGKKVVEIIKRGNYYEYNFFDKSIKFFNQDLINSINASIGKLKNLPDNSLISNALRLIQ